MRITNSYGMFQIWDNSNLIYQSSSYKKIQYYMYTNTDEFNCTCLLCKNGFDICHMMSGKTLLQHCIENQKKNN